MNTSLDRDGSYRRLQRQDTLLQSSTETSQTIYPPLIGIVATVAALYFGRDIFLPLAVAVLLTFALAPVVSWFRKLRIPRPVAMVSVVLAAFSSIFLFGAVLVMQLGSLAENLPLYQSNIEAKVRTIKDANVGEGIFDRVSKLLERLGRQIEEDATPAEPGGTCRPAKRQSTRFLWRSSNQTATDAGSATIIGPLIEPLATGGIIVVVVIFMLLKREDLRDRFIRLVGAGDLQRTTEALQERAGASGSIS